MGDKARQDPWEGGHTIQQRETRRGTTLGKADTPSNKGKQEGVYLGIKERQDLREGVHTIQQRERRRGTLGDFRETRPSERGKHLFHCPFRAWSLRLNHFSH